ncbi:MAG: thermonuclease family protein [Roseinatronobacter sp.]
MFKICSFLVAVFLGVAAHGAPNEITGTPRVIDGDTFEIAGQRIRIGGIDAPERAETCKARDGTSWPCGTWATDVAHRLVAGARLNCVDLNQRNHDRIVARCYLRGQDIAVLLIEAGAARPCLRFARAQGQEQRYLDAERVARARGAGIFGGPLNPLAGFCEIRGQAQAAGLATPPSAECAIKGNVTSNGRIYHMPGQRDYDRVTMRNPDTRWFCSEAEARAAGWRPARQ